MIDSVFKSDKKLFSQPFLKIIQIQNKKKERKSLIEDKLESFPNDDIKEENSE